MTAADVQERLAPRSRPIRLLARPLRWRALVITLLAATAAAVLATWSLLVGDFPVAARDAIDVLFRTGPPDAAYVVRELRLPRALTAIGAGLAFGLSGAILQRLARNPLASPDILGVNAGAAAAAVTAITVFGAGAAATNLAALTGAAATVTAVYLLSYREGVRGHRLVLVGVGVSATLGSITAYHLTGVNQFDAQRATVWLTGSLHDRTWTHVRWLWLLLCLALPLALAIARHLRALELGDDLAVLLGTRREPARAGLLAVAVLLGAAATAASGPIGFVALASPHIARRLVADGSAALLPSAAVGAAVLAGADLLGQRLFAPVQLPVGIVTAVLGAPFLLALLARADRLGSGG